MSTRHPSDEAAGGVSTGKEARKVGSIRSPPPHARRSDGPPTGHTRQTEARIAEGGVRGKDVTCRRLGCPRCAHSFDGRDKASTNDAIQRAMTCYGIEMNSPPVSIPMSDPLAQAIVQIGEDDALRGLLARVQILTGMRFAAIAFVSDDRWIASQVDDNLEFGLAAGDELDVHKTLCKEVRCSSREILIDDTQADPLWSAHAVPQHYGFRSYVSVPIIVGGSFFGTLCAIDNEPRKTPLAGMRDQLLALAAEASGRLRERMRGDLGLGRGLPA